jgi:aldehyde:ferredoxin oxidoreductase
MTTLTAAKAKTKTRAQAPIPGGYAGKLLRVDMTKGKCWAEPWTAEQMREQVGGIGLGAMILYKETAKGKKNASWDDPENRLIIGTRLLYTSPSPRDCS